MTQFAPLSRRVIATTHMRGANCLFRHTSDISFISEHIALSLEWFPLYDAHSLGLRPLLSYMLILGQTLQFQSFWISKLILACAISNLELVSIEVGLIPLRASSILLLLVVFPSVSGTQFSLIGLTFFSHKVMNSSTTILLTPSHLCTVSSPLFLEVLLHLYAYYWRSLVSLLLW